MGSALTACIAVLLAAGIDQIPRIVGATWRTMRSAPLSRITGTAAISSVSAPSPVPLNRTATLRILMNPLWRGYIAGSTVAPGAGWCSTTSPIAGMTWLPASALPSRFMITPMKAGINCIQGPSQRPLPAMSHLERCFDPAMKGMLMTIHWHIPVF